jgi:O-acetylhomoserine/O-acetylserine sulfhydrylase-like pyridoxal-dependent enzyme
MKKLYSLKDIACILKVQDSYQIIRSLETMSLIFKKEVLVSTENGIADFFQEKDKIHTILLKGMVNEEPLWFKVNGEEMKILQGWEARNRG